MFYLRFVIIINLIVHCSLGRIGIVIRVSPISACAPKEGGGMGGRNDLVHKVQTQELIVECTFLNSFLPNGSPYQNFFLQDLLACKLP